MVIPYKTVIGERAGSACIQCTCERIRQDGSDGPERNTASLYSISIKSALAYALIIMPKAKQSFSTNSCATTALCSLYHINTPHTLSCASKAPLQLSKWGWQRDPAKPPAS